MLTGVINRLKTLADGTIRIEVDIPREVCPKDVLTWLYEDVVVLKKEDVEKWKTLPKNEPGD